MYFQVKKLIEIIEVMRRKGVKMRWGSFAITLLLSVVTPAEASERPWTGVYGGILVEKYYTKYGGIWVFDLGAANIISPLRFGGGICLFKYLSLGGDVGINCFLPFRINNLLWTNMPTKSSTSVLVSFVEICPLARLGKWEEKEVSSSWERTKEEEFKGIAWSPYVDISLEFLTTISHSIPIGLGVSTGLMLFYPGVSVPYFGVKLMLGMSEVEEFAKLPSIGVDAKFNDENWDDQLSGYETGTLVITLRNDYKAKLENILYPREIRIDIEEVKLSTSLSGEYAGDIKLRKEEYYLGKLSAGSAKVVEVPLKAMGPLGDGSIEVKVKVQGKAWDEEVKGETAIEIPTKFRKEG